MKPQTFKEFAETILKEWTTEQQNATLTIYDTENDEFYAAEYDFADNECDVLDEGHPYLLNFPAEAMYEDTDD